MDAPRYDTADKLSESHEFRYHAPPTHTTHLIRDSNRSNTHNFRLLRRSCLAEEIENTSVEISQKHRCLEINRTLYTLKLDKPCI